MTNKMINKILAIAGIVILTQSCIPKVAEKYANKSVPDAFNTSTDTTNTGEVKWREFFSDPNLIALCDTALKNNQELNIMMQEIKVANNEVLARKGRYLPMVQLGGGVGVDNVANYTRAGAVENNQEIVDGKPIPETLPDFMVLANVSWQVDIWHQLRTAKKSAVYKYLASIEGRNFMVTHLVAEIAKTYYELMALDNQFQILQRNIDIQQNALKIVNLQKTAGMVTELAVKRFQAEVAKNRSKQYYIKQKIVEAQNKINFLVGRYPQDIQRNSANFTELEPEKVMFGVPAQLVHNRPDVRQAEQQLTASHLDIKVARAYFLPTLMINAGLGTQAFNPKYLVSTPESIVYNAIGGLVAPLINRNDIRANYFSANANKAKAAYNYEKTMLNAYKEVSNQMNSLENLANSYEQKSVQVDALSKSIDISISLFKTARADYVEVLLTQRDALEAKMELIEIKKQQMNAMVNAYQALGGGWR